MFLRKLTLFCLALASAVGASAQDALLLYHTESVPKRLMLNPAAPVTQRAWLSLPLIGHVDQTFLSPVRLGDVFDLSNTSLTALANGTSAVAWDDIKINTPAAIAALERVGRARITTRANLLSFGVHLPRGLVSLNLDQQADLYAAAGPDALAGLYFGDRYLRANGADARGYKYAAQLRTSLSLGYQINPDQGPWRFGINAKIVKYQAQTYLRDIDMRVTPIGDGSVEVYYEGYARIAGFADVQSGETKTSDLDWRRALTGGNYGIGVDLGVHYAGQDGLHLSASLTDFGLARLGYQTQEYKFYNTIRRGESDPLVTLPSVTIANATEEVTALSRIGRTEAINTDPYTRPLPTTLYLGGEYRFAERASAGVVLRNSLRGGRLQTATAASLNLRPWRMLEANTSISWADGAGVGVGFGASLQLAVVQVYVGSDNVLAFRKLEDARWANAFAGVTLLLPDESGAGTGGGPRRRRSKRREPPVKCYKF